VTPPKSPHEGEVWIDRGTGRSRVWAGDRWVEIAPTAGAYRQVFISKEQLAKMKQELTEMSEELSEDEDEA
jgi:hypothetical protein